MNENDPGKARAQPTAAVLLILGCALLTWLLWGWILQLSLLGWDSYPLIAASKANSLGEALGGMGQELMHGRYPLGHFWRPVVHASFALDYAMHGLNPWGYHLTDLILLGGCAFLLANVGRRLSPSKSWLPGLLAGLAWLLHPLQLEVLSVPARRAESLAILFTCWALLGVLGRTKLSLGRALWTGLLCAAALASKETGIIALPLTAGALLLGNGPRRAALGSWLPAAGMLGLAFALRTWVLGGLGGSATSSPWLGLPSSSPYLAQLLFPSAGLGLPQTQVPEGWLHLGLPLALGVLYFLLQPRRAGQSGGTRAGALLILWLCMLTSVSAMAGIQQSWYALPFLAPLALWLAGLVEVAWRRLRKLAGRRPMLPGGALLLCALLLGQWARICALDGKRRDVLLAASAHNQALVDSFTHLAEGSSKSDPALDTFLDSRRGAHEKPALAMFLNAGFVWERLEKGAGSPPMRVHTLAPYSLQALGDLLELPDGVWVRTPQSDVENESNPKAQVIYLLERPAPHYPRRTK